MSSPELRTFRWRRRAGLWLGVVVPASCAVFALINERKVALLPSGIAWAIAASGVSLGAVGCSLYRCPWCGRVPEDDIPNFDPESCDRCGAALK